MKHEVTKTITTTQKGKIELTGDDIIALFWTSEALDTPLVPKEAVVSVQVPRGGDYSGMTLIIGENDVVLTVSWDIVTVKEG
jgi:hypothetical protein